MMDTVLIMHVMTPLLAVYNTIYQGMSQIHCQQYTIRHIYACYESKYRSDIHPTSVVFSAIFLGFDF